MKNIVSILAISLSLNSLAAQDVVVKGPDEKLQLVVFVQDEETPCYSVTYNGKAMLEKLIYMPLIFIIILQLFLKKNIRIMLLMKIVFIS